MTILHSLQMFITQIKTYQANRSDIVMQEYEIFYVISMRTSGE